MLMLRRLLHCLAPLCLLVVATTSAANASAPELYLQWTATTGTGIPGSSHIQAEPGDQITAQLFMRTHVGVWRYHVSLAFDSDLANELDLVSATGFQPAGYDTVPAQNPTSTTESTGATAGAVTGFQASNLSTAFGPGNLAFALGEVVFTVNAANKDGFDVDIVLDGSLDEIQLNDAGDAAEGAVHWGAQVNPPLANRPDRWILIDDPSNPQDTNGLGRVTYEYFIMEREVTNTQYAEFLNAVDATGANPNGVYTNQMASSVRGGITYFGGNPNGEKYVPKPEMFDRPVNYVSFRDAARYVNWIENGRPTDGTGTESGAYDMTQTRPPFIAGAGFAIPTEDEWYKAAYFKRDNNGGTGTWQNYADGPNFDSLPDRADCDTNGVITNPDEPFQGTANYNANCDWDLNGGATNGNVTNVGATASRSHFGTYDQMGNVEEWTETLIDVNRRVRGGGYNASSGVISAQGTQFSRGGSTQLAITGFRLVNRHVSDADRDGIPDDGSGGLRFACGDGQTTGCDDNCPAVPNPGQENFDGDAAGDACDNCAYHSNTDVISPFTRFEPVDARDNLILIDSDRDGLGNICDPDMDGDGLANDVDPDSDGDGILNDDPIGTEPCTSFNGTNCDDNCPFVPNWRSDTPDGSFNCDEDGYGDFCDCSFRTTGDADADGDLVPDDCDVCPDFPDPDQMDSDRDGVGDYCDTCPGLFQILPLDNDGDRVGDSCDNCPSTANADQTDTDADGVGDACDLGSDTDADTIVDASDNCPHVPNGSQTDSDSDGIGDACDDMATIVTTVDVSVENGQTIEKCVSSRDGRASLGAATDGLDFRWINDGTPTVGQCQYDGDEGEADDGGGALNDLDWSYQPVVTIGADCCVYRSEDATTPPVVSLVDTEFGGGVLNTNDSDFDFFYDLCDVCPNDFDDQTDTDFDEVGDVCDNCPNDFNPAQADADSDGIGDVCELPEPGAVLGLLSGGLLLRGLERRRRRAA